MRKGTDVLLVSIGGMLQDALAAAEIAAQQDVSVAVWSCPTLKPLDTQAFMAAAAQYPLIITVEEGNVNGGLGGAVAEVLSTLAHPRARLIRVGVPENVILSTAHSQSTAREKLSLAAQKLSERLVAEVATADYAI